DKLNIAAIGIGGVGFRNLNKLKDENIVALCDVDSRYGEKAFRRWGNATRYSDFRVLFEKEKGVDAVVIATPDHTHAVITLTAMQLQKHVFVQSPMAHSVFEMRRMIETARVYDVVTQVGNQGASSDETRSVSEIIASGFIGEVRKILVWTPQPEWEQALSFPDEKSTIPRELNWDLFLGPCDPIPYHPTFTPYGWRAWWKFGNGTLGIAGPSLLEPVFRALQLEAPFEVEASSPGINLESAPAAQQIRFRFKRRKNLPYLALPEAELYWYDGGLKPFIPEGIPFQPTQAYPNGGILFLGSDGILCCGPEGKDYKVVKEGREVESYVDKTIHRIPDSAEGHEKDWVRACKEAPGNRLPASTHFESQSALTETLLVGSMAVRLQTLHRKLLWDSSLMQFSNIDPYEEFVIAQREKFFIENGIPKFLITESRHNAAHFVDRTVRPVYREGWKQL
ncbi:MAG TPA: Gfo/Idh/MocA family oxidoreductase, partial [Prolixibacteraceae bacterium]|nr:Gfo/Idh/MocA family oxidoreductase [Prolixibacteraceae bacterium]